jgi:class 3 adenylate cyclase
MNKEKESVNRFTSLSARDIQKKYPDDPAYAAQCLEDILEFFPDGNISPDDRTVIETIIEELHRKVPGASTSVDHTERLLLREILDFYVPRALVKSIIAKGGIPRDSQESLIGVGFIDIADYSYLSKFLSPKENQIILNGLYSCFAEILRRRGGYLNKSEGDAIMFQFGGPLDPQIKDLDTNSREAFDYISTQLFNTCVEMQRLCYKFNDADESILDFLNDEEEKANLKDAFRMLHYMRNDPFMSNAFNAIYQIRIRIGANVGRVSIGNFGPPGSKHWDIIGNPVIEAKRMESTCPIGGLRISESFYKALENSGIAAAYYKDFLSEAKEIGGYFREIKEEEVFQFGAVLLKDKKNVSFRTYSVQVNPALPESISEQISLLLEKGETGADKIVELIKSYRGNRHVIEAIEDLCRERGIKLRKGKMIFYLFPEKFQSSLRIMSGDKAKVEEFIEQKYKLFDVLKTLGEYQDRLKMPFLAEEDTAFKNYEQYMDFQIHLINDLYKRTIKNSIHNTYFFNVIFPLIFKSIKASILEYQVMFIQKKSQEEAAKGSSLLGGINFGIPQSEEADLIDGEMEELEEVEPV